MRRKLPRSPLIKSTNQKPWTLPYPSRSRQMTWINVFTHSCMHSNYFLWKMTASYLFEKGFWSILKCAGHVYLRYPAWLWLFFPFFHFFLKREREKDRDRERGEREGVERERERKEWGEREWEDREIHNTLTHLNLIQASTLLNVHSWVIDCICPIIKNALSKHIKHRKDTVICCIAS